MKIKKIVTILMSVITAASMLAGCSGEKKTANSNAKPYQIDWFFLGDQQLDVEQTEKAIADYLKDKINVTVKLNALDWGNVGTKITTMLAGNEKFDLLFVNSNNYLDLVSKNRLMPLDELLEEHGQGIKEAVGEHFFKGFSGRRCKLCYTCK